MLSLDIFAVVVVLGIVFLIYCFIGFSRAARRNSSRPAHPHKRFSAPCPAIFDRAKTPSKRNKMMLTGVSHARQKHLFLHDRLSQEERLHEQGTDESQLPYTATQENTMTPHRAHVEKLRFLVARRRLEVTYSNPVLHVRYATRVTRR